MPDLVGLTDALRDVLFQHKERGKVRYSTIGYPALSCPTFRPILTDMVLARMSLFVTTNGNRAAGSACDCVTYVYSTQNVRTSSPCTWRIWVAGRARVRRSNLPRKFLVEML